MKLFLLLLGIITIIAWVIAFFIYTRSGVIHWLLVTGICCVIYGILPVKYNSDELK